MLLSDIKKHGFWPSQHHDQAMPSLVRWQLRAKEVGSSNFSGASTELSCLPAFPEFTMAMGHQDLFLNQQTLIFPPLMFLGSLSLIKKEAFVSKVFPFYSLWSLF